METNAKTSNDPQLIVKEGVTTFVNEANQAISFPEILILANSEGFAWLSERCSKLSERAKVMEQEKWGATDPDCDPDDHQHLSTNQRPFKQELCDRIEFRFGMLTESNTSNVLERYGIDSKCAMTGSYVDRSKELHDQAIRIEREANFILNDTEE